MRFAENFLILVIALSMPQISWAADAQHHTVRFLSRYGTPCRINTMVFSPDGSELAVSTSLGKVSFIRTSDGETTGHLNMQPHTMGYSGDGSRLLMISFREQKLFYTDSQTVADVSIRTEKGFVGITHEQKNGKWIITRLSPGGPAAKSGEIRVGDELVGVGQGRGGPVRNVRGLSLNRFHGLIAGPAGTYVRLQVIHAGELEPVTCTLQRHLKKVGFNDETYVLPNQSAVPDGIALLRCMSDGVHKFLSTSTGKAVSDLRTIEINNLGMYALSSDSRRFAVLADSQDGLGIEVFDVLSRNRLAHTELPRWPVPGIRGIVCYDFVFNGDGTELLIGRWDSVEVFNLASNSWDRSIRLDEGQRKKSSPRPTGFAASAVNSVADSLGVESGGARSRQRMVNCIALSRRGVLATGDPFGRVKLWNYASGELLKKMPVLTGEDDDIDSITFSPDGQWLAYYVEGVLHLVNVGDVGGK